MARSWALPITGVIALLISTACAMFTLLLAIALSLKGSAISPLALAAGILDVLGIGWISYLFASVTGSINTSSTTTSSRRRTVIPTISTLLPTMLISSSASSLTFATAIWIHVQPSETVGTIFGHVIGVLNIVDFTLWGATIIAQSAFIALCFHDNKSEDDQPRAGNRVSIIRDIMDAFHQQQEPPRHVPQPQQVQMYNMPAIPPLPMKTPYLRSMASSQSNSTAFSADAKSSIRSTYHGGIRSVTSRSRLIRQKSWAGPASSSGDNRPKLPASHHGSIHGHYAPSSSRHSSISMDHSVVDEIEGLGIALRPSTPPKTRLETIPGSRANSPARALDGPFPKQDHIHEHDDDDVGVLTEMCISRRGSTASSESSASILSQLPEKNDRHLEQPLVDEHSGHDTAPMSLPQIPTTASTTTTTQPGLEKIVSHLRTSSFSHPKPISENLHLRRPSSEYHQLHSIPPPDFSTFSIEPVTATASPISPVSPSDQSHIHPLFRTDSPLPPPTATTGTNVTAAAFSGQFMTPSEVAATRSVSISQPTNVIQSENKVSDSIPPFAPSMLDALTVDTWPGLKSGLDSSRSQSPANEKAQIEQQRGAQTPLEEPVEQPQEQPRKTFEAPRPAPPIPTAAIPASGTAMSPFPINFSSRAPTKTALALAPRGAQIVIDPPTPAREQTDGRKGEERVALGEVSGNASPRALSTIKDKGKGKAKVSSIGGLGTGVTDIRENWWI